MDIRIKFTERANVFKEMSNRLYEMVDELGEKIIILDLSDELGITLKSGYNTINNNELFEEIRVEGLVFNLMHKSNGKYKAYVLHFEKEYSLPYLGFMYKKEIVSPHIEGQVPEILRKYNDQEINEILIEVDKRIDAITEDISYLNSGINLREHKFYYRNYDGMFDGSERFNDLKAVIKDFESLVG